jgi:hypothetical protein
MDELDRLKQQLLLEIQSAHTTLTNELTSHIYTAMAICGFTGAIVGGFVVHLVA